MPGKNRVGKRYNAGTGLQVKRGQSMFKFMVWMTVLTTVGFIVLMIFDYK